MEQPLFDKRIATRLGLALIYLLRLCDHCIDFVFLYQEGNSFLKNLLITEVHNNDVGVELAIFPRVSIDETTK